MTKAIIKGCHTSRFISSWVRSGGTLNRRHGEDDFREWLESLGLSKEEVDHIRYLASNGKMELEQDAKQFIETKNKERA